MVGAVMNNVGRTLSGIGLVGFVLIIRLVFFGTMIGSSASSSSGDLNQEYGLSSHEVKAYKACLAEIRRGDLEFRGTMSAFCGCFAKRATLNLNDTYKPTAASYFRVYARTQTAPTNAESYFIPASYDGNASSADEVARSVRRGGNACTEEASQNARRRY